MGQTIQILETVEVGDILLVTTDRTLTGQDGESYTGPVSAAAVETFAAQQAVKLFEADPSIDYVYVMSNALSIRRRGGWTPETTEKARQTVAAFFRFYPDREV
jgi:hypothetical protein